MTSGERERSGLRLAEEIPRAVRGSTGCVADRKVGAGEQARRHVSVHRRHEYAAWMELTQGGDIVTVAGGGPTVDGIVFDAPSRSKVVVAVMDPKRGPVFRTVHPNALSARSEQGAHDRALRLLVRKTPPPARGAARGGRRGGQGPAGYTRSVAHRSTGR